MNDGVKPTPKRLALYLLAFGGLFFLTTMILASRLFPAWTYISRSFLQRCFASCSRLMTLGVSAVDGIDLFAVSALLLLLSMASAKTISRALRVGAFSRSLERVEMSPRLHRLLQESALLPQYVLLFPSRLSFAFTAGLFFPRIRISTRLVESLDDDEIKAVLRHEQSHIQRRDPLRGLFIFFISQFFFFLPQVEKLLKHLKRESELTADRHALSVSCSPADLASALVKISRNNLPAVGEMPGFAGNDFLGERLSRILGLDFEARNIARSRSMSLSKALVGLVLAFSLVVLALPTEKGFLKTTPWRCSHSDRMSCCATDAPGGHHSHCRS